MCFFLPFGYITLIVRNHKPPWGGHFEVLHKSNTGLQRFKKSFPFITKGRAHIFLSILLIFWLTLKRLSSAKYFCPNYSSHCNSYSCVLESPVCLSSLLGEKHAYVFTCIHVSEDKLSFGHQRISSWFDFQTYRPTVNGACHHAKSFLESITYLII